MTGFSVDPHELDIVAGKARALADAVREDAAWRFDVDVERWPPDDPLRAAVVAYQQSLRAAVKRLCAQADGIADDLGASARSYRDADDELRLPFDGMG